LDTLEKRALAIGSEQCSDKPTRAWEALVAKNSAMEIAHGRRRETFPLGTPNKAAAITLQELQPKLVFEGLDLPGWRWPASMQSITGTTKGNVLRHSNRG